jgi:hypothetical protein
VIANKNGFVVNTTMISLEQAKRSDRLMRVTTSLTVLEFEDLAQRFDVVWSAVRAAKTSARTPRQRQPGGGSGLPALEPSLLLILSDHQQLNNKDPRL